MSSGVLNSPVLNTAFDGRSREPAIGLLAETEFEARAEVLWLDGYSDYEDWLDSRLGLQMGLAMSGVDAALVEVGLAEFREWCALARTTPNEDALDAFATLALNARNEAAPRVLAELDEADFSRRRLEIAPVAGGSGFRHWRRQRETMRAALTAAGVRFESLPVRVDNFLAWCACVDERPSESTLDRYAGLLLEHLTIQ
jgi:hypothetical protein